MASFSNEFLQRLKDSVNILDVIGSYVELTKKGRYYFASCPFHGPEKTPSFSVSPEKGFLLLLWLSCQRGRNILFRENGEYLF